MSVVARDLNGDGTQDLAVASLNSNDVSIVLDTCSFVTTTAVGSSANPSLFGQSLTFTATVTSGSGGSGVPTGTVTFKDGPTVRGTAPLAAGTASLATATLSVGTHSITAVYAGDSDFASSTSTLLTQTVNPASADLSIIKTDGQTTAIPGSTVVYTIVVSNTGPSPVSGATVTDAVPADLTGVTWMCVGAGAGSCMASGSGSINDLVNLPVGGTVTYTLGGTISASATGSLSNTAMVPAPSGVIDPNLTNNSATDTDTLDPQADLSITKTDGLATAVTGQSVTYTIAVSNSGPSTVAGATVTDTVPAAITGATWTCVGAGGGSCTASGSDSINDIVTLPVGGTVTYSLTGTVSTFPAGSLSNTATVLAPGGVTDPDLTNDSATDTDVLPCAPQTGVVVPDGRFTSASLAPAASQWFLLSTLAGHSYSVEIHNSTGSVTPGTATLFRGDDGCALTSTAAATDTTAIDPAAPTTALRMSFTSSGADPVYRLQFDNTTGSSLDYSFSVAETTLFSPAWSTNGSYNTYYSFQNTTSADLNGTLTLFDISGNLVSSTTLAIPAGTTKATNTVALGTVRNTTGTARFTHDGPPGAFIVEADIANFTFTPAYVQPVRFRSVRETR